MQAVFRPPAPLFCLSVIAAMAFQSLPAHGDAPTYRAQFLTTGISTINAAGMNEAGDVVGTGTTGSGAWVSRAGATAMLLPVPPGAQFGFANDINDAGVIVGSVSTTSSPGFGKAAEWIPDGAGGYTIVQFGALHGHVSSDATAINNLGDVVGYSSDGTFRSPVLFSAPGAILDLSSTGIFDPVDINDQRVVVDHSYTAKRLDLDTMVVQDLGKPPGSYNSTNAEVINEAGQVAGAAILATSTDCKYEAARYTDGIGWEILSGCGSANSAWDMNDLGDVVMRLNVAPYVAFEGLGTFLIEDLITADVGHWFVTNGYGLTINNSRQMAVPASNDVTGQGGIILLTPIGAAPGDLDGDGDVDLIDLTALLAAYGSCSGDPAYIPAGDLDSSGCIDLIDLSTLLANYGR